MDITIIRNRSQKGVRVEKILIGSERVGRVQGGHHNNPVTVVRKDMDVYKLCYDSKSDTTITRNK